MTTLDDLGRRGWRRLGTRALGGDAYDEVDLTGAVALVVGNEAHGLAGGIDQRLDGTVTIPLRAAGRVAQRRHGRDGAVLRGSTATPGRGPDGLVTLDELRAELDDRARPGARRGTRPRPTPTRSTSCNAPSRASGQPRRPRRRRSRGCPATSAPPRVRHSVRSAARSPRSSRPARAELADAAVLDGDVLDLTLGGHGRVHGHLHLITQVQRELEDIFVGLGYRVAEGPEVEDDWHNFEALNIPEGASGAIDAGHALRRARRRGAGDAPHAHLAGADPHDGDAGPADLRRRARAHVPQRDARRAPLAGLPPDGVPRGRPRPHDGRPLRHDRGVREAAVRRRERCGRGSAPTSSRTPSRRPSSR